MAFLNKLTPALAATDYLLFTPPAGQEGNLVFSATSRAAVNQKIRAAIIAANDLAISSITVSTPGNGYTAIPPLTITGANTTAAVATVSAMQLATVAINAGGAGYIAGDVLTVSGGTQTNPAKVRVDSVAAGVVTGVTVIDAGTYTAITAASAVTGGNGTGFTLNNLTWGIKTIAVGNSGNGFVSAPGVSAVGGTGFSAVASMVQKVEDTDYFEFDLSLAPNDVCVRDKLFIPAGHGVFVRSDMANSVNFFANGFLTLV